MACIAKPLALPVILPTSVYLHTTNSSKTENEKFLQYDSAEIALEIEKRQVRIILQFCLLRIRDRNIKYSSEYMQHFSLKVNSSALCITSLYQLQVSLVSRRHSPGLQFIVLTLQSHWLISSTYMYSIGQRKL